jgi:anti-sigma B factor antagonist
MGAMVRVQSSVQDGVHVLRLDGELVADDDGAFVAAVTDLFTGPGTRVILDLSGVKFLNSTGLGELVRVAAQANIQECRVALAAAPPFVAGVLQTTRLDRFFESYPSAAEALRGLR